MATMELSFLYCTRTILRLSRPIKNRTGITRHARHFRTSSRCKDEAEQQAEPESRLTFLQQKVRETALKKAQSTPVMSADETRTFYDLVRMSSTRGSSIPDSSSNRELKDVGDTDHTNILGMFSPLGSGRTVTAGENMSSSYDPGAEFNPDRWRVSTAESSPASDLNATHIGMSSSVVMRSIDLHNVARSREIQELAQQYLEEAAEGDNSQSLKTTINDFTSEQMKVIAAAFDTALNQEGVAGDIALWNVLTSRIFPIVALLPLNDLQQSSSEKGRPPQPSAKPPKLAVGQSNPAARDSADQHQTASKESQVKRDQRSIPTSRTYSFSDENDVLIIPSNIPALPVISRLYPASLLLALRLLKKHYPTSSFPAALLSQIRALGPASYVLGANIHFHNTFLAFKYDIYSKLSEIDALLFEMERGGVEMDTTTYQLLERIEAEREADMQARMVEFGSRGKAWWQRPEQVRWMQKLAGWKELLGRRLREKASQGAENDVLLHIIRGEETGAYSPNAPVML